MDIQNEINEEIKEFEKNMYRERCPKLPDITEKDWDELTVDKENKQLIEDFLAEGTMNLRPKTKKQYTSGLHIFAKWLMDSLNNKKIYKLNKKDFLRFQNFLIRHGMSSNGIKFKRSAVSSMCNYFETYYFGEDDRFENFRNITKGVDRPAANLVYKKVMVTDEEYDLIKKTLLEDNRIREYSMFVVCMETGMRGGELRQIKRTEINKKVDEEEGYFLTDTIFGKGGGEGKALEYMINQEAYDAMIKYYETKDENDSNEYLFTVKNNGTFEQVSDGYFEWVCREIISDIVGRRINEHIFRASCASRLLLSGTPEILVSKYVLHHNDLSTLKFYDLRDFKEEKAQIFGKKKSKKKDDDSNEEDE